MGYLNQVKQCKHRAKFIIEKILFILRDNGTVVFNQGCELELELEELGNFGRTRTRTRKKNF